MTLNNSEVTTKEAFEHLIYQVGVKEIIGLKDVALRRARMRLKDGTISTDYMEKLLKKAGYKVLQEKTWVLDCPKGK